MKYVSVQDLVEQNQVVIKTGPFGTQLKASEYVSFGTPVLNVRNLGFATVNTDKLEMVSDGTLERLSAHKLVTGDIVFGRKGAVERHAFISESENGWMQGSDCIRLRVLADSVNPRFLSYYFLTKRHRAFMMSMCSHGTTMASLNQKIIEKIIVPLPERSIQDKIVEILATLDKQIATNQKINENLQQQAQAIFNNKYAPSLCSPNWVVGTIGDVVTLQRGYDLPKDKMVSGSYPVAGSTDTIFYHNEYTTEAPCVVMGRSGNIGKPRLYMERCWAHNTTLFVKDFKGNNPYWSYYMLRSIDYSQFRGGSAVPTLNRNHVHSFEISIPPVSQQNEFAEIILPLLLLIENNRKEIKRLSTLREALLPKLMAGELDVSSIDL